MPLPQLRHARGGGHSLLGGLCAHERDSIIRVVTELILATDMGRHADLTARFAAMTTRTRTVAVAAVATAAPVTAATVEGGAVAEVPGAASEAGKAAALAAAWVWATEGSSVSAWERGSAMESGVESERGSALRMAVGLAGL